MRFLLSFLLVFLCVFATAQEVPPMKLGGPQGIEVNRSLNKFWMSVPIYVDTPVAPLTGSGWPGAGYLIQATKNYREATVEEWTKYIEAGGFTQLDSIRWQDNAGTIYFLPNGIDTSQVLDYVLYGDTSVWHYTGRRWRRVGGNAEFYFNYLLDGGEITQLSPVSSRQFLINPAEYYISGLKYKYDTAFKLQAPPKTPDSTGRIDVITIAVTGPKLVKGTASRTPFKPKVPSNEIELSTIYFRPFDTIPSVIGGSNGSNISSIYRVPGKDSIFYTVDTLVFKVKDSVGISTASNGLTAAIGNVKLGGSLIENTNINLSSRRLSLISGSDTTRFFANGGVSIGGNALDSTNRLLVRGDARVNGILRLAATSPSNSAIIRNENSNDGSLAWVGNQTTIPANFGARNVVISPCCGYNNITGQFNTIVGRAAGDALTTGGNNTFIGVGAGASVTAGANNTHIGAAISAIPSGTFSSIHLSVGGTSTNTLDTALFGLSSRYAMIGGGSFNTYVKDFYFGGGHRVQSPDDTHVNFYAPSGWPSKADTIGSNFTINAGRGTGTGLGGSVIFRTSPTTTTGTTLQTLTERARITPRGNFLVGTSTDSTFRLNVSGTARVSDTLTLSTSPVTSDTTANDLLVINSSNGQVRRYTGAWPAPVPTLKQVTTAGNSTTDTIKINNSNNTFTSLKIYNNAYTGGTSARGVIEMYNSGSSGKTKIDGEGIRLTSDVLGEALLRFEGIGSYAVNLPDSSGILTQRIKINGTTYNTSANGVIDMNGLWINGSATLDFPSTNGSNKSDLTITVTGAAEGDVVSLGVPNGSVLDHSCYTAWVSATNQVTVRFANFGTGSLDPASGVFKIKVFK